MPTKHNKKRYQSTPKARVVIVCTGRFFLAYRDEEEIAGAQKGDLMWVPSVEQLKTIRQGEYERRGYAGYFRVGVWDGREWQPVLLSSLFPGREHYFSKTERPIDTFEFTQALVGGQMPLTLVRTYREHYAVEGAEEE